jgi:tRNA A37 threonylcarbamoyladenosine synthetase subunit TsaC/SUA5/YrdC
MPSERWSDWVFLTPTDTTTGFVSQNAAKLDHIKGRPADKHYICALPSLNALKQRTRIPQAHKNRVRRARKSTFIYPGGDSYRIVRDTAHRHLIERLGWAYTTSANPSGKAYDPLFAREAADVIVSFPEYSHKASASKIYKIGRTRIKRIR